MRYSQLVNPHNTPQVSRARTVFEYLVIIIGIAPMALMVNWVLLPHAFVGGGLPILLPVYSDYAVTQLGVESSWKSKDLTVNGSLVHNNAYTGGSEDVNMVPEWQIEASMEYNLKRRLFLNAAYTYQSERNSWGNVIPSYSDLTVVLTGIINRHFAVYLKGGNLLGGNNYRFYAIPELPRNLGGGLRVNF